MNRYSFHYSDGSPVILDPLTGPLTSSYGPRDALLIAQQQTEMLGRQVYWRDNVHAIGSLVRVRAPYCSAKRGPGVDAWTGRVMRVLAIEGPDALLGRPEETLATFYEVAINLHRLEKVSA